MDDFARIESAAHSGATGCNAYRHPTPGQQKAGNYRMGRAKLHGLTIAIEQPRNSYREGVGKDGKPWRSRVAAHYGYLVGTKGMDGDGIDCFIGPVPESQKVFAINQVDPDTGKPDELKLMIGFLDMADARRAYLESYERGWQGLGSIVPMTVEQLRWWLKYGNTKAVLTKAALPHDNSLENDDMTQTAWDGATPIGNDYAGILYGLRREDAAGELLDSATLDSLTEGTEAVALDALVVPFARFERKMEQMQAIMNGAGGAVTIAAMQVTPPFKQRGTTNVAALFELSDGQTVSIFFHNPDLNPKKVGPQDELISWKWMLNRKDITIVVAPERGSDLNVREVARRIMRLAEKNSAKFQTANKARADRLAAIEGMKSDVESKQQTLAALNAEIVDLTAKVEAKAAASYNEARASEQVRDRATAVKDQLGLLGWNVSATSNQMMVEIDGSTYGIVVKYETKGAKFLSVSWQDMGSNMVWQDDPSLLPQVMAEKLDRDFRAMVSEAKKAAAIDPTTPEGYAAIRGDQAKLEANQDQLDSFFQGRIIAVRNALRELGWEGERYKDLTKGGARLVPVYQQVGAGANIVGVVYKVAGENTKPGADDGVRDDLSITPAELAAEIDYFVKSDAGADNEPPFLLIEGGKGNVYTFDGKTKLPDDWVGVAADSGNTMKFWLIGQDNGERSFTALKATSYAAALQEAAALPEADPAPAATAEQIAAEFYPTLTSAEKTSIDNGFMPSRVADAAKAAGVSPKETLRALQALTYDDSEAEEQAKYTKFDPSLIKMPTPAQLGMNGMNRVRTFTVDGVQGWTNGHILDLAGIPKVAMQGIEKYLGGISGVTPFDGDRVKDVVAPAKRATTEIEPVAFFDDAGSAVDTSAAAKAANMRTAAPKPVKFKHNWVVFASADDSMEVIVDRAYAGYFMRNYKGAKFYANDPKSAILVKQGGEIVGVMMPIRSKGGMLARARKAAPAAEAAKPNETPVRNRIEWEEAVYLAMENTGMTRSDAQAVAEARGSMLDDQFAAGASAEDAAAAILGAPAVSMGGGEQVSNEAILAALEPYGYAAGANGGAFKQYGKLSNGDASMQVSVRAIGVDGPKTVLVTKSFQMVDSGTGRTVGGAPAETDEYASIADALVEIKRVEGLTFAEPEAAPANDALAEAKAYLQTVIDGGVDYFAAELADKLTALYEAHNGNAEFDDLFERAAQAYSDAMVEAAKKAMS